MKAAVIESIGSAFTFANIDVADPERAEALIDVKASGLCHTDLTFSRHDLGIPLPTRFGHEVAGWQRFSARMLAACEWATTSLPATSRIADRAIAREISVLDTREA